MRFRDPKKSEGGEKNSGNEKNWVKNGKYYEKNLSHKKRGATLKIY